MSHHNVVWGRGLYTLGTVYLTHVLQNMQVLASDSVQFGQQGMGKQPNYQIRLTGNESKKFNGHHGDFQRMGIAEDEPFNPENLSIYFSIQDVQEALNIARKLNI